MEIETLIIGIVIGSLIIPSVYGVVYLMQIRRQQK